MIDKLLNLLLRPFNMVVVREQDKAEYVGIDLIDPSLTPGKYYKITCITGHGVSKGHKTTWEVLNDIREISELESEEVGDMKMRRIIVSRDSLAGILSMVTFDMKNIGKLVKKLKKN